MRAVLGKSVLGADVEEHIFVLARAGREPRALSDYRCRSKGKSVTTLVRFCPIFVLEKVDASTGRMETT